MATAILMKSGGGGAGSDELTASADKVLSGYTYVGADTDDEAGSGSMANIEALDAAKSVATGSNNVYFRMSRGAHLTNSSSGYPEAYAPYSSVASAVGLTSAKLLKGQTVLGVSGTATSDANATAAYIYKGKTAYVDGSKITGSMSVSSLVSFSVATYSTTQVTATWTWPSKGPYSGIAICGKTGGYPANIGDSRLYTGAGSNHNLGAKTSAIIADCSLEKLIILWHGCTAVPVLGIFTPAPPMPPPLQSRRISRHLLLPGRLPCRQGLRLLMCSVLEAGVLEPLETGLVRIISDPAAEAPAIAIPTA